MRPITCWLTNRPRLTATGAFTRSKFGSRPPRIDCPNAQGLLRPVRKRGRPARPTPLRKNLRINAKRNRPKRSPSRRNWKKRKRCVRIRLARSAREIPVEMAVDFLDISKGSSGALVNLHVDASQLTLRLLNGTHQSALDLLMALFDEKGRWRPVLSSASTSTSDRRGSIPRAKTASATAA